MLASTKKSMNATSNFAKLMDLEVIVISDQSQGHIHRLQKNMQVSQKLHRKIKFKKSKKKCFVLFLVGETSVKVINKNGKRW